MEGQSICGLESSINPGWPTNQAWSLLPCPEATHIGSVGRCRTHNKYSPSEVCPVRSGRLVPAKTRMPEPDSRWPREGRATPALGPEGVGALKLRRTGRRFCGFCVRRTWHTSTLRGSWRGCGWLCHLSPRCRALSASPHHMFTYRGKHHSASGQHQLSSEAYVSPGERISKPGPLAGHLQMSDNWREGGSALRGAGDVRLAQGASQVPLLPAPPPPCFLLEPNNSAWHK